MRTFIAIELSDAIRQRLAEAQDRLRSSVAGVKWVEPENIHLSLKFLGEIEPDLADLIAEAMAEAAQAVPPFEMRLVGLGAFPPRGAPRVLWAGIEEPTGRLLDLQRRVEAALEALDFEREARGFSAHVTLGRVKDPQRGPRSFHVSEEQSRAEFGLQRVEEIVLFQSELSPAGPTYTPLRRCCLGQVQ